MHRMLCAILLLSSSAIAYEILLMRMLSIVHWHHFAWMVISLALLGYAASGTAIALGKYWLMPRFRTAFPLGALLLSATMVGCFVIGQRIPFNALEVVWAYRQWLFLCALYLVFMIPFFFAALCIGLALAREGAAADRIYFSDLMGAGIGAALVIAALFLLLPGQVLVLLAATALLASLLTVPPPPHRRLLLMMQISWGIVLLSLVPSRLIEPEPSEFKGLNQALQTVDTRIVSRRSGPLGQLTVVESRRIPFRYSPGLSFAARSVPPEQLAVFTDGDGMSVISRWNGGREELAHLADVTSALPYHLLEAPHVLILGAGAGMDTLQALYHNASSVDAVELNPQLVDLVRETFADYAGRLYDHPRVRIHIGEARGFVARSGERYGLIQVGLLDSFAVSGSGVQALNENYLYTVEAVREYLNRLEDGGLLSITRWLKIPPRDSLKLVATVVEALRRLGVEQPESRMAMIRSWNTITLVVKNGRLNKHDVARIRDFAHSRSFDTVWYPAMPASEANRFNRLERPYFYRGVAALLGDKAAAFRQQYKFNIEAATDERPYFFDFFKWRVLPEVLSLRGRGGAALIEWGYLVPAATLIQGTLAGAVLILLPLAWTGRRPSGRIGHRAGAYFFLLGLAFMFVEIAFIQKFTLFLSHPLYSVVVVLSGFLVFAGAGSGMSPRLKRFADSRGFSAVATAVSGIAVISIAYAILLPVIFSHLIGLGDFARIALSLALTAPLAFFMGMPFPLGLKQLASETPDYIPWAWGINGFASVLSAALATLLAIQFGFTIVLLLALLLYLSAASLMRY